MLLLTVGTWGPAADVCAAAPHPSSTPTATPTPILHSGAAEGFNGVAGDCDEDGNVNINELVRGVNIALERQPVANCSAFDTDGNGRVTVNELVQAVNIALHGAPPTFTPTQTTGGELVTLIGSSPSHGEGGVAVTRETILRFDGPIDPSSVTEQAVAAVYGGGGLFSRLHLSPDQRTVTVFYETFLPASARVRVLINGGFLRGANGTAVDVDSDGQPGGVKIIDFDTLNLTALPGTAVCGRVFASELIPGENGTAMNAPLPGVTIHVDGAPDLQAVTDQFGNFRLEPAPVGRFFVYIRGKTATVGVPPNAYYPDVGKAWQSIAGTEVNIGDVFLPLITAGTLQEVSTTTETVVRFPESVRSDFPELADVRLTVPADSLYGNNGERGGMVGIAPVSPDRLPSRLPPGLDFPLVITVQTEGGENFDKPVPVCFPNLPDRTTGQPLAPGAASALWSFNHDTGQFEVVAPMRVTADGRLVCTEPGFGILAPGWHGTAPGAAGGGGPLNGPAGGDDNEKGGDSPPPGSPGKPCKKDSDDGDDAVDPVYLFSGEFYEEVEDLRIKGRGLDFVWSRKYRSKIGPNTVQGNGWDFSYNISLIPDGADLVVCDGNSRRNSYHLITSTSGQGQANGTSVALLTGRTWSSPEFFDELTLNADGTLTQTFPDGGTWLFNPLDGTPVQGKIRASTDRNGNSLRFAYDGIGRLATVTDTLDRNVSVTYNVDGFIASVADFAGREVRYEYYRDGDADGAFGDLKSVRSPVVTDTPNRNDFPDGKLTTYTYSTGFADDRLNHNLLTITDGRRNDPSDPTFGDGPYVVNVYSATQDADDINFDRVTRQMWGGPNDIVDLVYVPQTPSSENGNAYIKTIINDRVGNVKEYYFEPGNRVVIRREYTGRAVADKPTTDTVNRPTNRLRPEDPPFFETRFEWNDDALMTREVRPNGTVTEYIHQADLDPGAPTRARGNLVRIRHLPGALQSDQAVIEEQFEYDDRFGCGGCGGQFVTREVDARGGEILHTYDERGNRTQTVQRLKSIVDDYELNEFGQQTAHILPDNGSGHRRRDESTYYDSGPQRGYLRENIIDAGGAALTTRYEYDAVGNVIRRIDARGHDRLYDVNALDQVVRTTSSEILDGSGVRHTRDFTYDANNNLVRVDTQNVDADGAVAANAQLTAAYEYELLNMVVRKREEVDATRSVTTEYAYDANRNLTLTRYGEATAGRQLTNSERREYDERDLLFRTIAAEGAPEQSTTQRDYDGNRNLIRLQQETESEPRISVATYDGYDRAVRVTDPMGNVITTHYDANGNDVATRIDGELNDQPGSSANVRLLDVSQVFDPVDRLIEQRRAFFDSETQAAIGDGAATTHRFYNDASQLVRIVDDNAHERRLSYDNANRPRTVVDAKGNRTTLDYDGNGNVIRRTQTDVSDVGEADASFVDTFVYDNLDRPIRMVDSIGNTRRFGYDSRGNRTVTTDGRGNVTRIVYDAMNRITQTIRELTDSGDGSGAPAGRIATEQVWDDSSRLIGSSDDNGNATTYEYDSRDRRIAEHQADETMQGWTLDVHGNRIVHRDANGNTVRNTYDLLNRLVARTVERGSGVAGTTFERFAYDGQSRIVQFENDDAAGTRRYDSLSNLTRETLNGESITNTYDAQRNQLTSRYPGGRQIARTYDPLDRVASVADDAGPIATYFYAGRHRIARRDYGNGTRLQIEHDGRRRVTRTTHSRIAGGDLLDDRRYTWDAAQNQTSVADLAGTERSYRFDSVNRLVQSRNSPAGSTTEYVFDGVGNRISVTGGQDAGDYALDAASPAPRDRQVNQYTRTGFDGRGYDANGNLVAIDREPRDGNADVRLTYDYLDRLIDYDDEDGAHATYAYDALGRRIAKVVENGTSDTTRFFYDRAREIEEQDGNGTTRATSVYGAYVDELLTLRRGTASFFVHADNLYNVRLLTDAAGNVVERYAYGDYGQLDITDAAGTPRAQSAIGNAYGFNGRRRDAESGYHFFRFRYLDPRAGRFLTRDPLGAWIDPTSLGNPYTFVGNNPTSRLDPFGLAAAPVLAPIAEVGAEIVHIVTTDMIVSEVVVGAAAPVAAPVAGIAAVVALAAFAIVDQFVLDNELTQTALDAYFGGENMPDPGGGEQDVPDVGPDPDPLPGDPTLPDGAPIEPDPIPLPGPQPAPAPAPQPDKKPEQCEEEKKKKCPPKAFITTAVDVNNMTNACKKAQKLMQERLRDVSKDCPPRCGERRHKHKFGDVAWKCSIVCAF